MDLCDPKFYQPVVDYLQASEKIDKVLYTNSKKEKSSGIKNVRFTLMIYIGIETTITVGNF